MVFGTIEQAIADIHDGKFVIVADDEDRENEGDLICAAQLVTPEMINFMIKKAGGLICLALTGERVLLEPMTAVERKVVHERLQDVDGVQTESEGAEPNRYVVVLPA